MPENDSLELDRLVAVDVMGFDLDRGMPRDAVLPGFGSDLAAAWQVVDQLARRYPGMKLKLLQDELGWSAVFSDRPVAAVPLEASGRTPAEAIARAALAVVKRMRRAPQ